MSKSQKELLNTSTNARKRRNDAAAEVEQLHAEMLAEFDASTNEPFCDQSMLVANGVWQMSGNAKPATAEMVSGALMLFSRTANMLPPLQGETPKQYAMRAANWINDRWRERGFK